MADDEFSSLLASISNGVEIANPQPVPVPVPELVSSPVPLTSNSFADIPEEYDLPVSIHIGFYILFAILGCCLLWWAYSCLKPAPTIERVVVLDPKPSVEQTSKLEGAPVSAEGGDVDAADRADSILKFVDNEYEDEDVLDITGFDLPRPKKKPETSSTRLSDESPEVESYAAKRAALFRDS